MYNIRSVGIPNSCQINSFFFNSKKIINICIYNSEMIIC